VSSNDYVPLVASTSLVDERSNPYMSDPIIASIVDRSVITTAAPCHVNLEFQNNSELERISNSNYLSIDHGKHASSSHLSSHNSVVSNFSTMVDDDDDGSSYSYAVQRAQATQNLMDMNDLFDAIKTHLSDTTQQLSGDFRRIVDNNTRFKQEMREELEEMKKFLADQTNILGIRSSSNSSSNVPSTYLPVVTTSSPSASMPPSLNVTPSTPQHAQDVQSQMLMILTDSFSKLSSALSEKSDSKSDWPKFSGDAKKFHSWYLAIMAQLSLPPWMELYDEAKHDIKTTTTNVSLNGKLYSKLLLALDGSAQSVVSKKYLRANGISLLQDLVQTYKPKKVPEIIAAKTGEFWSTMKRSPNESIDSYFNRFHELLDDLNDAE
jgi:hypothetical protein